MPTATHCGNLPDMHAKLIDELGGPVKVAGDLGLDRRVVANWRGRGVAYAWRNAIAKLATARKISIPRGFLDPPVKGRVA